MVVNLESGLEAAGAPAVEQTYHQVSTSNSSRPAAAPRPVNSKPAVQPDVEAHE